MYLVSRPARLGSTKRLALSTQSTPRAALLNLHLGVKWPNWLPFAGAEGVDASLQEVDASLQELAATKGAEYVEDNGAADAEQDAAAPGEADRRYFSVDREDQSQAEVSLLLEG